MSRGLGKKTIALREEILAVLEDFNGRMSSRQVAYQLVGRQAIENTEKEKERVGRVIVDMRKEGLIPYTRIVDRTRSKHQLDGWNGVTDIMEAAASQYRRNLWADQPVIPMVACEKRALEGVFSAIVDEYGVSLWTFGGFNSLSFDYEWSEAIKEITETGKRVEVAYFGDHDPDGICIEDTSFERLGEEFGADFEWARWGLHSEDFSKFEIARIPVKKTSPRAKVFLKKFGDRAAELDALPPAELESRIRQAIEEHIDGKKWEELKKVEAAERDSLKIVIDNWEAAVLGARGAA
jgi:hypothetical protein